MDKLILLGIPVHGNINPQVVACLLSLTAQADYPGKVHLQSNCYVHDARNKIVAEAQRIGATHLMFIDADTVFPPDGVQKLLARDLDIVGGLYFRRQPPHLPTINQLEGDKLIVPTKWPKDKPFEVFGIGTGFLLIKMSVFEKIKPPYFYFCNFHGRPLGEDIYFCRKAREAGFKVWCDPTIPLQHIGEYAYDQRDFDLYQEEIGDKKQEDVFDGEL